MEQIRRHREEIVDIERAQDLCRGCTGEVCKQPSRGMIPVVEVHDGRFSYALKVCRHERSRREKLRIAKLFAAGSTPRDVVNAIAEQADEKIEVGDVSEELPEQTLPRGKVLFGTPAKYLRDICTWNGAAYWEGEDGKLTVETVEQEIPADRVLHLTPMTGLVGTPIYTDQGIQIKMLLDARVKLRSMIKIDNELIQRQAIQIDPASEQQKSDQLPQTAQFDKDGEYQVFSVEHKGDTWGDEWTTSVIGVSRNGRMGLLTAVNGAGQTMK